MSQSAQVEETHDEQESEVAGMPVWLENAFPWLASAMLHVGAFLLILFASYAVRTVAQQDIDQIVVPSNVFADDPLASTLGAPAHGDGGDASRDAAQNVKEAMQSDGWSNAAKSSTASVSNLLKGAGEASQDTAFYGNGQAGGGSKAGGGKSGGSGGEGLAPFGVPGGGKGGTGPKTKFYGSGGNAIRICFILDSSGSMIDFADFLKKEVRRSILNMIPVQSFGLIFFSDRAQIIQPMTRATTDAKQKASASLESVIFEKENDELLKPFEDAFRMAFDMRPNLIYFLTDGQFDERLLESVKTFNRDKKVTVNTLKIVHGAPKSAASGGKKVSDRQLEKLATENNGRFVSLNEEDAMK